MSQKMLRPDSKGRITLGHLADGVSNYAVTITKDRKIILVPYAEIPAKEKWLFDNKKALKSLDQGLEDAAVGRVSYIGSFAKYTDNNNE